MHLQSLGLDYRQVRGPRGGSCSLPRAQVAARASSLGRTRLESAARLGSCFCFFYSSSRSSHHSNASLAALSPSKQQLNPVEHGAQGQRHRPSLLRRARSWSDSTSASRSTRASLCARWRKGRGKVAARQAESVKGARERLEPEARRRTCRCSRLSYIRGVLDTHKVGVLAKRRGGVARGRRRGRASEATLAREGRAARGP